MNTRATISRTRAFVAYGMCNTDLPSPSGEDDWILDEAFAAQEKTLRREYTACSQGKPPPA